MKKAKLTDKVVAKAVCPPSGETILWDSDTNGFGLRLRASGGKSWFVKRKGYKATLGDATERGADAARAEAAFILAELAAGRTPARKARSAKPRARDLFELYMTDWVAVRRTEATLKDYRRLLDNHVLPRLGDKLVDDVAAQDIDRLLADMRETPAAANKAVAFVGAAFSKGLRWGIRSNVLGNPCTKAELHELESHEEYLEAWELEILLAAIDQVGRDRNRFHAAACLRLLALSGTRRDEIRELEWTWVDWDRGRIDWEKTKTGKGHLVLNRAALDVLEKVRQRDGERLRPHVFMGLDRDKVLPKSTLYRAWADAKKIAAANGVDPARMKRLRPHDLRHSFATLGLSHGLTLDDVGKLLRHKDKRSTERYARHLPSREITLAHSTVEFLPVTIDA
jgi:integrase